MQRQRQRAEREAMFLNCSYYSFWIFFIFLTRCHVPGYPREKQDLQPCVPAGLGTGLRPWTRSAVGLWFTLRRSSSMSSYTLGKTISMWNMLKQPRNIWSSTLSLWNYIRFFKNLLCQRVVAQISLNYLPEARPSDPVSNQNIGEKSLELQCSNALLPAHARICQLPTIPNEGVDWKRLGSNWLVGQWSLFTFFPTSGLSLFHLGFTWYDLKVDFKVSIL